MIPADVSAGSNSRIYRIFAGISFVLCIISFSVSFGNWGGELEGEWIEAGEHYKCAKDGGTVYYVEAKEVNDGHDDCPDGSDEDGSVAIANISRTVGGLFLFISIVGFAAQPRRGAKKHRHVVQQVVQPVQRIDSGSPTTNVSRLVENARNLERARDFDAAAQMYQQAGMFDEAGRVRRAHLEKEQGAVVQIGHVGDNVLNDSVMVQDGGSRNSRTCPTCQKILAEGWSFCPNCDANK